MIQKIQQLPPRQSPVLDAKIVDNRFSMNWSGWLRKLVDVLNGNLSAGYTGTITTAKLTGGGANGSMTFQNGILVSETPAT